jgi:CelD/BcsL family acetyltransferase involved in cellulose biosynthesis
MIFSNDQTANEAVLNTLGDELAAAWARFYATEVNSRPGELEYDRALAAAKKLEAAVVKIVAAGGRRSGDDWPF